MHILMLFLDGIGLGADDPATNPFAAAHLPTLNALAGGQRWLKSTGRKSSKRALFVPTDACLGVAGRPQSGSGQAAILTGLNVPQLIGEHYGPKPNSATREILNGPSNIFTRLKRGGRTAALLDAYPPGLHHEIGRGKTLPSSIQYAAIASGQGLFTVEDVVAGRAVTPEWTGQSWHTYLKLTQTPIYTPQEAGHLLVNLSRQYDFAFHSHWMTDHVGHRGPLTRGIELLELFDGVLQGVLEAWDDQEGLVIITSDHGNMEDLSHKNHTENPIPTVIIGSAKERFGEGLQALTDYVPRIYQLLGITRTLA